MAEFEEIQDALFERVKQNAEINKYSAFEVAVPSGYILPMENNSHLPYVVMMFGGKSPVAMASQGIAGTKQDLKWTSVAFECVAESPSDVRKLVKIIRDLHEGYQPDPGWGELVERLTGDYAVQVPDYDLWPVRYATGIVFNTNANASV